MAGKSGGSFSSPFSGKGAGTTPIVGGGGVAARGGVLGGKKSRPAPPGALGKVEDAVGKFAATTIARDQIVLTSQVSAERRTSNLSASIPPGKVAFWMPLPDLLVQSGGLQPGDRVDILLSLTLSVRGAPQGRGAGTEDVRGVSTQTTLQNVEVFFTGSANNADLPPDSATAAGAGQPADAGAARLNQGRQVSRGVAFLLNPPDAVLAKWVKDSGGTIDLVLRSDASPEPFNTESVTADTVIERFKFR